jgi:dephospho-CoA kinase
MPQSDDSAAVAPVRRPPVYGLCGAVGSGKSAVAAELAARGAVVVDADRLAHEALDLPDVRSALVAEFGTGIVGTDGRIERARLRPLVFGPTPSHLQNRRLLESHVHPVVRRMIVDALAAAGRRAPPPPFVALDVPLLTEGPTALLCDAIVYVDAPEAVRFARTAAARGWTADEHRAREAAQHSPEEKRARARFVIDNGGDRDALSVRADRLFSDLVAAGRDR